MPRFSAGGGGLVLLLAALTAIGCVGPGFPGVAPYTTSSYQRTPSALDALLGPARWSPEAVVAAPQIDAASLEQAIHARVNEVRREHDLPALSWAGSLADVARGHSRDMAEAAFFGHTNLDGETPTDRAERLGIDCGDQVGGYVVEGVGENLFLTHRFETYEVYREPDGRLRYEFDWKTQEELARQAVDAWMTSRTHRANVLSPLYNVAAVGVVLGENETLYVTQNLARLPTP